MTYRWIYLCSNPERLKLTLQFLPRDPLQNLGTMSIAYCSHLDPPERKHELHSVLHRWRPTGLLAEVIDLSPLERFLPEGLRPYWSTGKNRWSLGVKLLLPYLDPGRPLLYTDDDVIVPQDPWPLLEQGAFGSKGCFRFGYKKQSIQRELATMIGLLDIDSGAGASNGKWYDDNALDAGVWYMDAHEFHHGPGNVPVPTKWHAALHRFAELSYISKLTTGDLELRCLDQRFITLFGIEHGWRQQTIRNGFAPPRALRPSFFNTHFIHYKSQSKAAWMKVLEDYNAVAAETAKEI